MAPWTKIVTYPSRYVTVSLNQTVQAGMRPESERRVTVRPAPDVMTYVTALLPAAQGIAVHEGHPVVPVTIDLVMTDRARFAGATDSAQCPTGCHIGCRWRNDVSAAASAGACVSASVWFAPSSITSSA